MPLGMKKRKRLLHLRHQSDIRPTLPAELAGLEGTATVVVWFDSGRERKPDRVPRFTTAWAYQPLGGTKIDDENFLLSVTGRGGLMRNPPDPRLVRRDGSEIRAFDPRLPTAGNFDIAPVYVTDLIAAWYSLAALRVSGYTGRVDMVTDGKNAVDIMGGNASPAYILSGRNVGRELKVSISRLSLEGGGWHFAPKRYTRFLDARQSSHKIMLREIPP